MSGFTSLRGVSPTRMYTGTYPSLGGRNCKAGFDSGIRIFENVN